MCMISCAIEHLHLTLIATLEYRCLPRCLLVMSLDETEVALQIVEVLNNYGNVTTIAQVPGHAMNGQ